MKLIQAEMNGGLTISELKHQISDSDNNSDLLFISQEWEGQ